MASRWLRDLLLHRRITRAYRVQVRGVEERVPHDLLLIGHPEYPRKPTTVGLIERLDSLLDLNRRLLASGLLMQDAADHDAQRLLALRREVVSAADDTRM